MGGLTVAGQCRACTGLRWAENHSGISRSDVKLNQAGPAVKPDHSFRFSVTACGRLGDVHLVPADRADRRVIDEDRVCAAIHSLDPVRVEEWSQRFALLSDPTRLSLLLCIRAAGPISVTDLAVAVDQNADTVSQTLRLLRAYRAVRTERDGRVIRYQIADPTICELLTLAQVGSPDGGE
jgi:ArsR family transcriptional regulator, lead/cadmium/zinc/bismuth-responsive transcriptional repressor